MRETLFSIPSSDGPGRGVGVGGVRRGVSKSLATLALLAALGCHSESGLSGRWTLATRGGTEVGNPAPKLEYVFNPDGSFTATGTLPNDGQTRTFRGTYQVHSSEIEMSIPEKGTRRMSYTLTKDRLTLKDPRRDAWVELRREGE